MAKGNAVKRLRLKVANTLQNSRAEGMMIPGFRLPM